MKWRVLISDPARVCHAQNEAVGASAAMSHAATRRRLPPLLRSLFRSRLQKRLVGARPLAVGGSLARSRVRHPSGGQAADNAFQVGLSVFTGGLHNEGP